MENDPRARWMVLATSVNVTKVDPEKPLSEAEQEEDLLPGTLLIKIKSS
jgi:hypothetical protein